MAFALAQPPADSAYIPPNLYLVRAKAISVIPIPRPKTHTGPIRGVRPAPDNTQIGRLVVTHVYLGPDSLLSKEFECRAGFLQMGSRVFHGPDSILRDVNFIEKGAEGLWWITRNPETGKFEPELHARTLDQFKILCFPVQKSDWKFAAFEKRPVDVERKFKVFETWAESAEKFSKVKSDAERAQFLRALAADDQSVAAGWAVALLGRAKKADDITELKRIAAKENYRGLNQPAIDEVMCRVDSENWKRSDIRKRMIRRWLDGRADHVLMSAGGSRLQMAYPAEIDSDMVFAAFDDSVAGSNGVQKAKSYFAMAQFFRGETPRKSDEPIFFEHYLKYAEYPDSPELRVSAAIGLWIMHTHKCLTTTQYERIRQLRASAEDPNVVKQLDYILK